MEGKKVTVWIGNHMTLNGGQTAKQLLDDVLDGTQCFELPDIVKITTQDGKETLAKY